MDPKVIQSIECQHTVGERGLALGIGFAEDNFSYRGFGCQFKKKIKNSRNLDKIEVYHSSKRGLRPDVVVVHIYKAHTLEAEVDKLL